MGRQALAAGGSHSATSTCPLPLPAAGGPQEPGCPGAGLAALAFVSASDFPPAVYLANQLTLTKDGDHLMLLGGLGIPAQMAVYWRSLDGGRGHLQSKA
jgi:hypothetical protein